MIDLSRRVTAHAVAYHEGTVPLATMGRELRGSTLGVIGYGAIGRELMRVAHALGMKVLGNDPCIKELEQTPMNQLLAQSDLVVRLAVAPAETEKLMGRKRFG